MIASLVRERSPAPAHLSPRDTLTTVELLWVERRLEHSLRFGRVVSRTAIAPTTTTVSFRAGAVFALMRRSANDFGTVFARIDILRAVRPDEGYTTVPFVQPGGELYLSIKGWTRVRQVLALLDAIEGGGVDLCDVAPEHWRHLHNRLSADEQPRPYSPARHDAWLKRRAIEQ